MQYLNPNYSFPIINISYEYADSKVVNTSA
jgi:hypothetical protein